ncbi:MAG: sulfatase, partial [bacterium]|nr:sulfatase [bacterium]
YDLVADPEEQINLAEDQPDTVNDLRDLADSIFDAQAVEPSADAHDRREREALEALGYIQ